MIRLQSDGAWPREIKGMDALKMQSGQIAIHAATSDDAHFKV